MKTSTNLFLIGILMSVFSAFVSMAQGDVSLLVKQPSLLKAGGSHIIEIEFNKQDIKGFAKYEIEIPKGFAIRGVETAGANFIKDDGLAKFVWIDLPDSTSFKITYQIYVPKNGVSQTTMLSHFHYVKGDNKLSQTMRTVWQVRPAESFVQRKSAPNTSLSLSLSGLAELIKDKKQTELQFRVQVGAFQTEIDSRKVYRNLKPKPDMHHSDQWFKYTVGPFKSYEEAVGFQSKCGIQGAFLVVFYKNQAIDLAKAYRLANQN